ncbi:hypothetical protein Tco_0445024 [Tanacetum coccineum]
MVPIAVLMKSGLVSVNTARQVNTAHSKTTVNAARPMSYFSKTTHSTVKRPIHKNTSFKNSNINQRVNTIRGKGFNIARAKAVVNVVKGNNVNAVKASACWVWKLKTKVLDHVSKHNSGNPQMDLHNQGVIDSGCSMQIIGNMSYLINYEEIDRGYVAFRENPKGGKITGKCAIKTELLNKMELLRGGIDTIKAARTMLDDSKLPTTFWAEAVNTACYTVDPPFSQNPKSSYNDGSKPSSDNRKKVDEDPRKESKCNDQEKEDNVNITNNVNVAGTNEVNIVGGKTSIELLDGRLIWDTTIQVSYSTTRIHKDHPLDQVIRYLQSLLKTRRCQDLGKNPKGFKEGKLTRPYSSKGTKVIFCWFKFMWMISFCCLTKKELCNAFEKLMHVGLQSQIAAPPMETQKPLLKDEDGEEVDVHMYRSMIGSLMYLTSSRPDIMFAVCACARYQVNPKVSHLHAAKRIFRYLKGQPKLVLWYLKMSLLFSVAYTDSDYAGASLDRKSTIGGCQFFGCRLISWQCKKQTVIANSITEAGHVAASSCYGQLYLILLGKAKKSVRLMMEKMFRMELELMLFWSTAKAKTINGEVQLHARVDGKEIVITESFVRRDLQLEDEEGIDCLPNFTIFENLAFMGYEKLSDKLTFYKSFFSLQWKFLIHTILQCLSPKTTAWNKVSSTMASAIIYEAVHKELGDRLVRGCHYSSSLEAEQDRAAPQGCVRCNTATTKSKCAVGFRAKAIREVLLREKITARFWDSHHEGGFGLGLAAGDVWVGSQTAERSAFGRGEIVADSICVFYWIIGCGFDQVLNFREMMVGLRFDGARGGQQSLLPGVSWRIRYQESGIGDSIPLHDYMINFVVWIEGHVPSQCYVSLIRKMFRWGTIFLIGIKRYRDPKEEPIEKEPLMELKEIG